MEVDGRRGDQISHSRRFLFLFPFTSTFSPPAHIFATTNSHKPISKTRILTTSVEQLYATEHEQRAIQRPISERPDSVLMLCFAMTSRVSDDFQKPLLLVRARFPERSFAHSPLSSDRFSLVLESHACLQGGRCLAWPKFHFGTYNLLVCISEYVDAPPTWTFHL